MPGAKTTLYLPRELRSLLKQAAARRGTSLTKVVVEGAKLFLDREGGQLFADPRRALGRVKLRKRADEKWDGFVGSFRGPTILPDEIDEIVYDLPPRRRRPKR